MLILHSSLRRRPAFTLIELLVVMAVIAILAAISLQVVKVVQSNAAKSRTTSEIHAITVACESYKTDNAVYPRDTETDKLEPKAVKNPTLYRLASLALYKAISGDTDASGIVNAADAPSGMQPRVYLSELKKDSISWTTPASYAGPVLGLFDPFGNYYGYSTAQANYEEGLNGAATTVGVTYQNKPPGFNSSFDLWSTAGDLGSTAVGGYDMKNVWITNWQ